MGIPDLISSDKFTFEVSMSLVNVIHSCCFYSEVLVNILISEVGLFKDNDWYA